MIVYIRVENTVFPYWINTVTNEPERLTWKQLVQGGDIPGASEPFNIKGRPHTYNRMGWSPFFIQPQNSYTNPRSLKPDGTRITDNDWYYQD